MTSQDKLESLYKLVPQVLHLDILGMIAREIVKLSREVLAERNRYLQELQDSCAREAQLKEYLRDALRGWIAHTPKLDDAIEIWQIARATGLGGEKR